MPNSIEVINLSKNYESKKAVTNINFKINENEIVGLLGPNGCGKTTTIGMILGLLKPTSGQILINGMNLEKNKISLLHKMNLNSLLLFKSYRGSPPYADFGTWKKPCYMKFVLVGLYCGPLLTLIPPLTRT